VQDETTIQHAEGSRPDPGVYGVTVDLTAIVRRPRERYVPDGVRCANCGCSGSAFEWPQRIRAGAVDGTIPERTQRFRSIVCLGADAAGRFGSRSPPTDAVRFESWSPKTDLERRSSTLSNR
jgi:hypothetical protein